MGKPFSILKKKMSKKAQAASAAKTQQMLKEMPLQELRQAHQMSQERIAKLLDTKRRTFLVLKDVLTCIFPR